ncbi:hypothetical protein GOC91_28690 [Sinorhizobium medicae]|uniref:Uncharacterized protein n=2 Tax=Sinorhizobium medicae TaxID=110321 RepID=A0A508WSQ9_9HYPH|nr:hypothetical protein [Sinorhizobium medicae]ABR60278.1 conserved hypothetical protein [Sinorhizobium medicae WSM419]MBO1940291.1 hypothetical protein [Sinorhizobium medicae]MBO1962444.1 hypothetical protein [Sinorhizobium medicae]MDX0408532.1 hypothetical protein [Sinorhizobium medicae]MDX0414166.1 hypothetical protein [Sinorhizobium medicae]
MFTAVLLIASLAVPSNLVSANATVDDLQSDFETAVACRQIDGRNVWKGELAYYIQSYVYEGDVAASADRADVADAVLPEDNEPETVKAFEEACSLAGSTGQARR